MLRDVMSPTTTGELCHMLSVLLSGTIQGLGKACFVKGAEVMGLEGISRLALRAVRALSLVLCLPGLLFAQQAQQPSPLTLQQAVNVALEKNPQRKAALADTRVASADVKEARSSLLPHVTFSETATHGNDPVYVFGSKLRQQRFTTPDFALNVLNTPTPFGNFATRFGGKWK